MPTDDLQPGLLAAELEGVRYYFEEITTELVEDVEGVTSAVDGLIKRLDDELAAVESRLQALEVSATVSNGGKEPWGVTATDKEWRELTAWVDWLNESYELGGPNRIAPCWPAHPGASEQLAALWFAWHAARTAQIADVGEHMISWHERWLWPSLPHITNCLKSCSGGHQTRIGPPLTDLSTLYELSPDPEPADPESPGSQ